MFGVITKSQNRLLACLKETAVNIGRMPKAKPIQLFGQCKDNMKIGTWQEILLPGKYPSLTIRTLTFRTMPVTARVVRNPFV
jgi:hypothetical protein